MYRRTILDVVTILATTDLMSNRATCLAVYSIICVACLLIIFNYYLLYVNSDILYAASGRYQQKYAVVKYMSVFANQTRIRVDLYSPANLYIKYTQYESAYKILMENLGDKYAAFQAADRHMFENMWHCPRVIGNAPPNASVNAELDDLHTFAISRYNHTLVWLDTNKFCDGSCCIYDKHSWTQTHFDLLWISATIMLLYIAGKVLCVVGVDIGFYFREKCTENKRINEVLNKPNIVETLKAGIDLFKSNVTDSLTTDVTVPLTAVPDSQSYQW
jgi:hypothetical protein